MVGNEAALHSKRSGLPLGNVNLPLPEIKNIGSKTHLWWTGTEQSSPLQYLCYCSCSLILLVHIMLFWACQCLCKFHLSFFRIMYWEYRAPADTVSCGSLACLCQGTRCFCWKISLRQEWQPEWGSGECWGQSFSLGRGWERLINGWSILYKHINLLLKPSLNCNDDFNSWGWRVSWVSHGPAIPFPVQHCRNHCHCFSPMERKAEGWSITSHSTLLSLIGKQSHTTKHLFCLLRCNTKEQQFTPAVKLLYFPFLFFILFLSFFIFPASFFLFFFF